MNLRTCLLTVLTLWLALPGMAQIDLTLSVDLQHDPLAPGEALLLRGEGPALDDWQGTRLALADPDGDHRYAIRLVLPDSLRGRGLAYKFVRVAADGTERWEHCDNRTLAVPNGRGRGREIDAGFFDQVGTAPLAAPLALTVEVDLTQLRLDGEPPEAVALLGEHAPLSWDLEAPTVLLTDDDGDEIWTTTVPFPAGTPADLPFKFAYQQDGVWTWEYLEGHTNHLILLPLNQLRTTLRLTFDAETGRFAAADDVLRFDDYAAVIAGLEARGPRGDYWFAEYAYYAALRDLAHGHEEAAQARYQHFRALRQDAEALVDDFSVRVLAHRARQGGRQARQAYAAQARQAETRRYQRALLGYTEGELMLYAGEYEEAVAVFRQVQQAETDEPAVVRYARHGEIHALLARPVTRAEGAAKLAAWAREADLPPAQRRRLLRQLALQHGVQGDAEAALRVQERLAVLGTPQQRLRSRLAALQLRLRQDENPAAIRATLADIAAAPAATWSLRAEAQWLVGWTYWHAAQASTDATERARLLGQAQDQWQALVRQYPQSRHAEAARLQAEVVLAEAATEASGTPR